MNEWWKDMNGGWRRRMDRRMDRWMDGQMEEQTNQATNEETDKKTVDLRSFRFQIYSTSKSLPNQQYLEIIGPCHSYGIQTL